MQRVDGHAPQEIADALAQAQQDERPSLIACRSVIGYGAPSKQGKETVHGAPLGGPEIELARAELGWPYAPFEVPADIGGLARRRPPWASGGTPGSSAFPLRRNAPNSSAF